MAYNPDEEPTRQIRYRPAGMPNQPANTPQASPPPPHAGGNPADMPEQYPAAAAPWQDYPAEPSSTLYPPPSSYQPTLPMANQAGAHHYSQYLYPPPLSAPPPQQAGRNNTMPAPSGAREAAGTRSGFNARQFWRDLTLSGQASGCAGLLMLICFFLPWLYTPNFSATFSSRAAIPTITHSGWQTASGGQLFSNVPTLNLFPHLWLVLLGALALIALAAMLGLHRIHVRAVALLLSLIALGALLMEFFFLIQVGSLGSAIRIGLSSVSNQTLYGTSWGFWLTVVATIAALGVGIYEVLEAFAPDTIRRPRAPGMSAHPGRQPTPTA